jgi:hypothetical protein
MPAMYIATMMESRHITWRPKFTSGLSDEGPDDKRLIIEFSGSLSEVPWLIATSDSYDVDLEALSKSVPELFDKKWLRAQGQRQANISVIGNNYIIEVQL